MGLWCDGKQYYSIHEKNWLLHIKYHSKKNQTYLYFKPGIARDRSQGKQSQASASEFSLALRTCASFGEWNIIYAVKYTTIQYNEHILR